MYFYRRHNRIIKTALLLLLGMTSCSRMEIDENVETLMTENTKVEEPYNKNILLSYSSPQVEIY